MYSHHNNLILDVVDRPNSLQSQADENRKMIEVNQFHPHLDDQNQPNTIEISPYVFPPSGKSKISSLSFVNPIV